MFVNGVLQREGTDYVVRDSALVFERPMKEEGKLGLMRWASIALGIAGSYKQNDSVDVAYERTRRPQGGCREVAGGAVVGDGRMPVPPSSPSVRRTPARRPRGQRGTLDVSNRTSSGIA